MIVRSINTLHAQAMLLFAKAYDFMVLIFMGIGMAEGKHEHFRTLIRIYRAELFRQTEF